MKKFLLGSIGLMLLFYVMALPFVGYYNSFEGINEPENETHYQKSVVAYIQLTNSIAAASIFTVFFLYYIFKQRKKKIMKRP